MSKQLAEQWFEAFRNKDIVKLESTLAEDFVHSSPFGEVNSRQAYVDLVKANPVAFFSPVIEIQDILESGDKVAVRYLVSGNPACDCIYAEDGKIAKIYSYYHYGDKPTM